MQHAESSGIAEAGNPEAGNSERGHVYVGARRLGLLLLTVHLAVLLWIALHGSPSVWLADSNLTPFASVRLELAAGTGHAYLELLGSLLALAPLGVLLPLAGGRLDSPLLTSFTRTLLAGVLVATGQEVLQTTLSLRLLNVDDILLACLGIALTHLAVVPAARSWLRRRVGSRPHAPETGPESTPEVRSPLSTGPARVRIIGRADGTGLPAREA
ncbi:VanZ family protein [Streptacidiphilus sp. MAP12-20]|uniref:VanZ family protein n=1 Tax=Streptacidiphilus sp. MAP12-20 TaxID=3156299 RepID=UPI003516BEAF